MESQRSEAEREYDAECLYCESNYPNSKKGNIELARKNAIDGHARNELECGKIMILFAISACNAQY